VEIAAARAAKDRLTVLIAGGIILEPHGRDRYRRLAIVRDRQGATHHNDARRG
jgi:hypothetical protein